MKRNIVRRGIARLLSVLMILSTMAAGICAFGIVSPQNAYAASVSEIKAGDHITMGKADAAGYTGTPYWRVLDKEEDGTLLLMSEYLWTGDGSSDASATVKFDPNNTSNKWQGSNAQKWCGKFADAVLSGIPGVTVLETTKSDAAYSYEYGKYTKYFFYSSENILNGDKAFFLSAEEVVKYMPEPEQRLAYMADGSATGLWLLRSALSQDSTSSGYTNRVGEILKGVSTSDAMNAVTSWTGTPARPAFRCSLSPELCIKGSEKDGATDWEIVASAHELGEISYAWAEDNSSCTAKAVCSICGDEISETAASVKEIIEEPTEEKEGLAKFTAIYKNSAFAAQEVTAPEPKLEPAPTTEPEKETKKTPAPVVINKSKVTSSVVKKAVKKAASQGKTPSQFVLGPKVKKVAKSAFKGTSVKTLVVKTKKLSKKSVKGSLKGSKIKKVKVKVSKKAGVNKKYVVKYKKIFTKKNAGKKVKVSK